MTIIFFGSSDFSLPALKTCLKTPHKVLHVITTPDQKKGRGLKESPSPVHLFCEERAIPVSAPANLKQPELLAKVQSLKPDLFVVASFGKIIPPAWLGVPSRAALNVHPSLLPKYRGAAPIQWALLNGEKETGITIAELTETLDAGDILHQIRVPIDPEVDSEMLSCRLAEISCEALQTVFKNVENGPLMRTPQAEGMSSYARKLKKEDGRIDWSQSAQAIANQIRGLRPWPTAYTHFEDNLLQVLKASVEEMNATGNPGELLETTKSTMRIQTGKGILQVASVLPAGKKIMCAADFSRGKRLPPGFIFKTVSPSSR